MRSLLKAILVTLALLGTAAPAFAGEAKHLAAGTKARKSFAHKPKPGDKAICPVSKEVFEVDKDTKTVQHKGKWYAFCCDDCAGDFEKVKGKL